MARQLQRQAGEFRRHELDAALDGEARGLRKSDRRCIGRRCKGRQMEVSVRDHHAIVRDDKRAFGGAVELDFNLRARFIQQPMQRPVHLGHDAQRQRILNAPRRIRGEERASVEQRPQLRADFALAGSRPRTKRARAARRR